LRFVKGLVVLALGTTFQVPGTGEEVVVVVAACDVVGAGFAARPSSPPVPATTPKTPLASRATTRIGIRIGVIAPAPFSAAGSGTQQG
jgi:hypothetical protein